jgi:hypothetical protein
MRIVGTGKARGPQESLWGVALGLRILSCSLPSRMLVVYRTIQAIIFPVSSEKFFFGFARYSPDDLALGKQAGGCRFR